MGKQAYLLFLFGLIVGFGFANIFLRLPDTQCESRCAAAKSKCECDAVHHAGAVVGSEKDAKGLEKVTVAKAPDNFNNTEFLSRVQSCVGPQSDVCIIRRVKVFCWIFTTSQNLASRASFLNRSWLPHCDGHAFFIGNSKAEELETDVAHSMRIVHLESVKESRDTLFDKTQKALEWLVGTEWQNDGTTGGESSSRSVVDAFDWFLKADDDTFAVIENLKLMLATHSPDDAIYFGRHFKKHVNAGYASGGAGYVLSRAAVHRFVEEGIGLAQCGGPKSTDEDVELGRCFEQLHVPLGDSRDSRGRQRFHPVQPLQQFAQSKEALWQSSYDHYPTSFGEDCCADSSVTFHYVVGPQQLVLYHFVYKMAPLSRRHGEQSVRMLADCLHDAANRDASHSSESSTMPSSLLLGQLTKEALLSLLSSNGNLC